MLASRFLAACSSSSKQAESSSESVVAESKEDSKEDSKADSTDSTVLKMLVPGYDSGYLKI